MHARHVITSTSNTRLKELRRLATARRRRATGGFVVEGYRLLRRALDAEMEVEAVYAAPALFLGDGERELVARAQAHGVAVYEVAPGPFAAVAAQRRPDGLLAVVRRPATDLAGLPAPATPSLLLVTEGVERPGNLGTMARTACAAAATGLLVCDPQTDVFHPGTVTASVGAVFSLPLAVCTSRDAIAWLREREIAIVAATPGARRAPWDVDLAAPVALAVGCEKRGLGADWLDAADARVGIPMPGLAVDSLNVAVAAGVLLVEAARQRLALRPNGKHWLERGVSG
jgi:RNA methyltransferase, TrmH family